MEEEITAFEFQGRYKLAANHHHSDMPSTVDTLHLLQFHQQEDSSSFEEGDKLLTPSLHFDIPDLIIIFDWAEAFLYTEELPADHSCYWQLEKLQNLRKYLQLFHYL